MIEIGDDLVNEILVRLPVKSLLRFKCVDKIWNDLFRKSTFANRNMKIHDKKKRLLICKHREPPRIMILENDEVLECPFPNDHLIWPWVLRGAYNGVFLIYYRNRSIKYLWNPTTKEVKLITPPPSLDPPPPSHTQVFTKCGFGGDPNTFDFKILFIVSIGVPISIGHDMSNFSIDYLREHPITFELYNLSTNSWTLLDLVFPVKRGSLIYRDSFFVNGFLHWISLQGTTKNEDCILCFDFRNNQFTTLDVPPYITIDVYNDILVEINDSLAYVKKHDDILLNKTFSIVDIWTLEQDTCCWIKKYIFDPLSHLMNVYHFWKDAPELLGTRVYNYREGYLVSYHPDGHIMHRFEQITFNPRGRPATIFKYVQSIASLSFS